jgi:hypothetical protein
MPGGQGQPPAGLKLARNNSNSALREPRIEWLSIKVPQNDIFWKAILANPSKFRKSIARARNQPTPTTISFFNVRLHELVGLPQS